VCQEQDLVIMPLLSNLKILLGMSLKKQVTIAGV